MGISDETLEKLKRAAVEAGRTEPKVLGYQVDIADSTSVQAFKEAVLGELGGRLDIVVNNAAYQEPGKPFLKLDEDTYWNPFEVCSITRTFLPSLLSTRQVNSTALCTMINVASSGALSARPSGGSYRSSKLAILRWTETLSLEYEHLGLVTFCVNPVAIKTKMTEGLPLEVRNRLPDQPETAGDTIVFLGAERREWLSGRYVSCPWDMEELMGKR